MKAVRALLIVAGLVVAIMAACYLAGALYFALCKAVPAGIELGTWLRYWDAYGDDPIHRKRLLVAIALAIAMTVVAPILVIARLNVTTRSLHGDARWATRTEIRKAGLL